TEGALPAQTQPDSRDQGGKVYVAGISYNNPPYHFMDSAGKPAGFDVDLIGIVASVAGLKIDIRLGSSDEIIAALKSGGLEMLAGTFQTEELKSTASFCTPYVLISYSMFAQKKSPISSLDDIRGKAIVVKRGDEMDVFARTNNLSARIVTVETSEDALRLVAFGHYDCALLPTGAGQYIARQPPFSSMVESVGKQIHRAGYGFAVAKGEKDLLDRLNSGLNMVITSGQYKELEHKWLANDMMSGTGATGFLGRHAAAAGTSVMALLALALLMLWLIRRQISARTATLTISIRKLEKTTTALKAEKQSLLALLRNTPYGTIVLAGWDWDAEILYSNQAFTKLFGYEAEETRTLRSLAEHIFPDEDYRSRIESRWHNLGAREGGFNLSTSTRDGKNKHVDFLAGPVGDGRIIIVFNDVTEKELLEEERQRLDEQIRQSQKLEAMGQLAGGVSHDLNNLLAPILGNAQLLLMDLRDDKEHGILAQEIVIAAKRAGELTKQLLTYARKGKFQIISVDIHKCVHEISSLLQHSIDKLIEISEDLQAARHVVMGDPSQIHGALLNLGVNARDAMPGGGKLVFATRMVNVDKETCRRLSHEITPGEYLEIRVSDTGSGMTKEVQQRLFEPFFTTKQIGKGTGLGLAAVFGCVKNHHGTITVESEPGKGSTFSILLPTVGNTVEDEEETGAFSQGFGRILVIDDEEMVRRFLGRTLEKLGYTVSLCQDGLSGVEFFKNHHSDIDLVILDMIMPNLDGKAAFVQMKKIDPAVRILIVSGYSTDKTAVECMQLGALGFLAKPCQLEELAHSVALCMGTNKEPSQVILK
ncbi:MAG: transporter substrate-binding domain-containing protein, partial [bacterium]